MNSDQDFLFGLAVFGRGLISEAEFNEHVCSSALRAEALAGVLIADGRLSREDLNKFDEMLADRVENAGRAKIAEMIRSSAQELVGRVRDPLVLEALRERLADVQPAKQPAAAFCDETLHAEGGLGSVFRARDVVTGRIVAIKRIRGDRAGSPLLVQRFLAEGKVTARLEHPNIVSVYQVSEGNGSPPFYVMQFLKGETLQEAIQKSHPLHTSNKEWRSERRRLVGLLVRICEAVAYAHSKGVIHRDLKPENIVLGEFGGVFLLDWGLSKSASTSGEMSDFDFGEEDLELTQPGQRIGTPLWMAPEQASGRPEEIDERTDIYGLGAILFHVLTGTAPHADQPRHDAASFYDQIVHGKTPRASEVFADVPRELEAVCSKAMAKKRSDRYQTAGELTEDLNAWLGEQPVSVYREPFLRQLARRAVTNPTRSMAAAGFLLAVVVATTVVLTSLWVNSQTILDEALAAMHEQTHAAQVLLRANIAAIEKDTRYLTTLPELPSALDKAPASKDLSESLTSIGNFVGHWKEYTLAALLPGKDLRRPVFYFDALGKMYTKSPEQDFLPSTPKWDAFLREVMKQEPGTVRFSHILPDNGGRPEEFFVATPIVEGESRGVFCLRIDLNVRFSDVFGTEFEYESIAMTDEKGRMVFRHRGPSRTLIVEPEGVRQFAKAVDFIAGSAPPSEALTYAYGSEFIMARKLPLRAAESDPYFGMIITGDRDAILRGSAHMTMVLLGITIGSIVLVSLLTLILGRAIVHIASRD